MNIIPITLKKSIHQLTSHEITYGISEGTGQLMKYVFSGTVGVGKH